jgi:hypothetical protein
VVAGDSSYTQLLAHGSAEKISRADDDSHGNAHLMDFPYLSSHAGHNGRIDAGFTLPGQSLTAEFQKNTPVS